MPKKILSQDLQLIADLIARHPGGIGIEGLLQLVGADLPRRTLQRRLALLIDQQRVQAEGESRALKYRVPEVTPTLDASLQDAQSSASGEIYVPLSAAYSAQSGH